MAENPNSYNEPIQYDANLRKKNQASISKKDSSALIIGETVSNNK